MYIDACKICQIASINVFLGQCLWSMSMICVYGLCLWSDSGHCLVLNPIIICMIFSLCCHSLCKSSLAISTKKTAILRAALYALFAILYSLSTGLNNVTVLLMNQQTVN